MQILVGDESVREQLSGDMWRESVYIDFMDDESVKPVVRRQANIFNQRNKVETVD